MLSQTKMDENLPKRESKSEKTRFTFTKTYQVIQNQKHGINNGTNFSQTLFNVINANLGTGILAMPFVFRLGGYWALCVTILIGILGNYTGKNLVNLLYEEEDNEGGLVKVRLTYADIGESFLPGYGAFMVHVINCIEQFSHCVLLLILPGTIIAHTFPSCGLSKSVWILMLSTITIPCVFFRKMKQVSWTSLVSVVIGVTISMIVFIYMIATTKDWGDLHDNMMSLKSPLSNSYQTSKAMKPLTSNFPLFHLPPFKLDVTPVSFGIIMVSFSSQAYMPVIEGSMQNPAQFDTIMNISYIFVTMLKVIVGVVLYLALQDKTEQIVTMNLPFNLFGDVINVAAILLSLAFFVIPMFAVFDIIENQMIFPKRFEKMLDTEKAYCGTSFLTLNLFLRFVVVLSFISVAAAVPHFSLFMSLVGNTTGTILVLIYPSLFYIKLRWDRLSIPAILLNITIILFAIVSCALGVQSSLRQLFYVYNETNIYIEN